MSSSLKNSFNSLSKIKIGDKTYQYYKLKKLEESGFTNLSKLPYSIRILLESLLRHEDGKLVLRENILELAAYDAKNVEGFELPFIPARVILQDFTGVPSVVDLAAMRNAAKELGADPQKINPQVPVDLVIDHSVQVDYSDSEDAMHKNVDLEFKRNKERYEFLHWGQSAFDNFTVIPPGNGIVHQINLEYLAKVVQQKDADDNALSNDKKLSNDNKLSDGNTILFPDSLVGTDSHTTMINGLGVLGWGVGGIEAEAVMLGQPVYIKCPEVVGVRLTGKLDPAITATDLVLEVTRLLRNHGVVEKFVEFCGSGVDTLSLADRATLANMAPEYGATVGFFPVDCESLKYLETTGRSMDQLDIIEAYLKAQGLFKTASSAEPEFTKVLELDLSNIVPVVSGPKKPQEKIDLTDLKSSFKETLTKNLADGGFGISKSEVEKSFKLSDSKNISEDISHGMIAIAAITSCTNTSNPAVLLTAGLLAKKAIERGLKIKSYVKTSLAPGSRVVTEYLKATGLLTYLEQLGFYTVGYGCTTCIGNSGPLKDYVVQAINKNDLVATSVLSGNRNFEGRISPHIKANFLASPPLVIAYAIAGTMCIDLKTEALFTSSDGTKTFLHNLWPTESELEKVMKIARNKKFYQEIYSNIEHTNKEWNKLKATSSDLYQWDDESSYIRLPPFFTGMKQEAGEISAIKNARCLVLVGDSITTDHISPAGAIPADSPAGQHLESLGISPENFNTFGSRRGNDQVMTRGTFGNIRLKNKLAPGSEGSWTRLAEDQKQLSIFDAAQILKSESTPAIVIAGSDYGMGSSRDWAAKGTFLLGVKAVLAKSYERIHRSNLVGMGVLPLQFINGESADSLDLTGFETFNIQIDDKLTPGQFVRVSATSDSGKQKNFEMLLRIDTPIEVDYYRNGGILHSVLRGIIARGIIAR